MDLNFLTRHQQVSASKLQLVNCGPVKHLQFVLVDEDSKDIQSIRKYARKNIRKNNPVNFMNQLFTEYSRLCQKKYKLTFTAGVQSFVRKSYIVVRKWCIVVRKWCIVVQKWCIVVRKWCIVVRKSFFGQFQFLKYIKEII